MSNIVGPEVWHWLILCSIQLEMLRRLMFISTEGHSVTDFDTQYHMHSVDDEQRRPNILDSSRVLTNARLLDRRYLTFTGPSQILSVLSNGQTHFVKTIPADCLSELPL
jgi:hypothetical protein